MRAECRSLHRRGRTGLVQEVRGQGERVHDPQA
jgi:hypothetical protein